MPDEENIETNEVVSDMPETIPPVAEPATTINEPVRPATLEGEADGGRVSPVGESGQIGVIDPIATAPVLPIIEPAPTGNGPTTESKRSFAVSLLVRAREKLQFRKRKKLDMVLVEIIKKGEITNDEVEKLLHTSDKTAERYLGQLLKEGKVKTNGKKGKAIEYIAN